MNAYGGGLKKKFLALLLALGGAALAEAAEKKPIQFRDLAWGASYDEISQQVGLTELEPFDSHSVEYHMYSGDNGLEYDADESVYDNGICYRCEYTSDEIRAIGSVAGQPLGTVVLWFVTVPDDSGALIDDAAHTALYMAYYGLSTPNSERPGAFSNLTSKLIGLYDVPKISSETTNIWHSEDGAYISLKNLPSYAYLGVWYASGDGEAWMQAASNANIDGL